MTTPLRACAIFLLSASAALAQEVVLEEVRVKTTFEFKLERARESAMQAVIERLALRTETQRALELEVANRTSVGTLLDLTKYIPIPLGGSDNRVDTFFLTNDMRPDLNPSEHNALFLTDERRVTR
jgi:hypothetical protein